MTAALPEFSLATALAMARFSAQAYWRKTISDSRLDVQVLTLPWLDPDGRESLVIAFRGSEFTLRDWWTNFTFRKRVIHPDNPQLGKVHRGYLAAIRAVWEPISQEVQRAMDLDRPIYLTGHSQGGGLAILAASLLHDVICPVIYTYGAPPVGNRAFQRGYTHESTTFRVELDADIVPWMLTLSSHKVGQIYHLPQDGTIHDDTTAWQRAWRGIRHVGRRHEHVTDHRISAYIRALEVIHATEFR